MPTKWLPHCLPKQLTSLNSTGDRDGAYFCNWTISVTVSGQTLASSPIYTQLSASGNLPSPRHLLPPRASATSTHRPAQVSCRRLQGRLTTVVARTQLRRLPSQPVTILQRRNAVPHSREHAQAVCAARLTTTRCPMRRQIGAGEARGSAGIVP